MAPTPQELKHKVRGIESKLEEKCQSLSFHAQRANSDLLYDEGTHHTGGGKERR